MSEHLGAPVFKVFNGIFWKHLLERGMPAGAEGRIALPDRRRRRSGQADRASRSSTSSASTRSTRGPLEESWRQQPGTPVYGKDYDVEKTRKALAEAPPERPAEFRAA